MRPGHQEPLRYRRPRTHAHLREHDHPTRAYVACCGPHRRGRVTLVHQHEPPDQRVKRATANPEQANELLRLLIKDIRVHDQHTIIPTYRIPPAVRTMHGTVGDTGLEPVTSALSRRRSPS
jgi:hypothetical protein